MADSIRVINDDAVRRMHANYAGRLHKGHNIVAASSSIPTTYQTIVTDNSDRKGFLRQTRRFADAQNENPGPGSYLSHETFKPTAAAFNKKGYGQLISKSGRIAQLQVSVAPGPGKYNLPSLLQSKDDHNKAVSSIFHHPIAIILEKPPVVPAPNTYKPESVKVGKANNVAAAAAFKSTTKRNTMNEKDLASNPGPGQYAVSDAGTVPDQKAVISSFRSTTKRELLHTNTNPSPGEYRPYEPVSDPLNKTGYQKKHYLCLSAPAMPLPPQPELPAPNAYEVGSFEEPEKHYMTSSMFVSSSSRWSSLPKNAAEVPGPGAYFPQKPGKESFIYNHAGRWI